MVLLTAKPERNLTEYVVKLLNNNKIQTVLEFLQEDTSKIVKITNLSLREVLDIRKHFTKVYGAECVSGLKYYRKVKRNSTTIPTGIKNLDILLDGGLCSGHFMEICGLPASGKTLLCKTIIMNLCKESKTQALYIDTKNDFSAVHMQKMLKNCGYSQQSIGNVLRRIKIERIYYATELIQFMKMLLDSPHLLVDLKIMIIDSLPAIWLMYTGSIFNDGMMLLAEVTNIIRRLCDEHNVIVIVVNIVTRWSLDIDDNEEISSSTKSQTTIKPSLGKYWQSMPSTRLLVEKVPSDLDSTDSNSTCEAPTTRTRQRLLKITKSNFLGSGNFQIVEISNRGFV